MQPKVYNNLAQGAETTELSQEFLENLYQKLSNDSHDDVRLNRTEFNGLMKIVLENVQYKMAGGMYQYSDEIDYNYDAIIAYEGQLFQCIKPNGPTTDNGVHNPLAEDYWNNVAKGIMALTDEEVIGVLNRKVTALQEDVSTLNTFRDGVRNYASRTKIEEAYSNIKSLQELTSDHTERLDNIDETNTSYGTRISANEGNILSLTRRMTTAEGDLSDGVQRDIRLEARVKTNEETLTNHSDRITTLETTSGDQSTDLADHENRIINLEEDIQTKQTKANHENDIVLLTNRVNSADDEISNLKTALATLRSDMEIADVNVRKKLYDEIVGYGEVGEFLNVVWNSTLQQNAIASKPLIQKLNMSYTSDQLALLKLHPVSMSTIFSEWQRFAHAGRSNTEANQIQASKNAWSYDKNTGEISSNINSSVYSGFISPTKHRQYYLKVKLRGNDTDNDIIGIVCAFYTEDDGTEHTLSVIRAKMIEGHTLYRYAFIYDYGKTTEKVIAQRNDVIPDVTGGWNNAYVIVDARRTGSRVIVRTTNINSDVLLDASEIDFALPTEKPTDWSDNMYNVISKMLNNPSQVGFGVFSENGRFTVLEQKYIFEDNDIYDVLNDQILRYVEKTGVWNVIGKVTEKLEENSLVWSPNINTLFLYAHGGVQVVSTSSEWALGKDLPMSSINNSISALQSKNTEQDNNITSLQTVTAKPGIIDKSGSVHLSPKDAVINCTGDCNIMIEAQPDFSEFKIIINGNGHTVTVQGRDTNNGVMKIEGININSQVLLDIKEY